MRRWDGFLLVPGDGEACQKQLLFLFIGEFVNSLVADHTEAAVVDGIVNLYFGVHHPGRSVIAHDIGQGGVAVSGNIRGAGDCGPGGGAACDDKPQYYQEYRQRFIVAHKEVLKGLLMEVGP